MNITATATLEEAARYAGVRYRAYVTKDKRTKAKVSNFIACEGAERIVVHSHDKSALAELLVNWSLHKQWGNMSLVVFAARRGYTVKHVPVEDVLDRT